jgi:hypothetical protein
MGSTCARNLAARYDWVEVAALYEAAYEDVLRARMR